MQSGEKPLNPHICDSALFEHNVNEPPASFFYQYSILILHRMRRC